MTAACVGTFIMAESGLLNHQQATTTWWLAPMFRKRYPDVLLDESNMLVKSGRYVTAGAALSHMDLALWLVRSVSPQLASLTAKYLIVDSRPSQSAYALTDHLIHSDPIVQRFETWARGRLAQGFSLEDAAKAVGSSKRTLARRTQSVLGKSPLSYFQSLRVECAVHLLKTGRASVDEIAERVGYSDGATLLTLLRRRLNLGVREIRRSACNYPRAPCARGMFLQDSVECAGQQIRGGGFPRRSPAIARAATTRLPAACGPPTSFTCVLTTSVYSVTPMTASKASATPKLPHTFLFMGAIN